MKNIENNPIKFTDRDKENKILNDSFIELMNNSQCFKVLSFYKTIYISFWNRYCLTFIK